VTVLLLIAARKKEEEICLLEPSLVMAPITSPASYLDGPGVSISTNGKADQLKGRNGLLQSLPTSGRFNETVVLFFEETTKITFMK
jgi:hypothetical protein